MSIRDLDIKGRSLLFARLAADAYGEEKTVKVLAKEHGFTKTKFYDNGGAQAFRFENKTDVVIACRGTQPSEFNDLKADLKAFPVKSETISRVHRGFKNEVDELWPMVLPDIENVKKELWFCGHSLGAAMATIMASRCAHDWDLPDPVCLFTYGSPRVGWPNYVKSLNICHYRWQNNNDIVTRVPLRLMGYRHDGDLIYIRHDGTIDDSGKSKMWRRFNDRMKGMWGGIKQGKVDNFSDHAMAEYIHHIENW
jgi:triacylglycerol lipase|tara:strand:- start:179 stop:934 length:756 start_codon:yes stop_codon:yes gene_type:complete